MEVIARIPILLVHVASIAFSGECILFTTRLANHLKKKDTFWSMMCCICWQVTVYSTFVTYQRSSPSLMQYITPSQYCTVMDLKLLDVLSMVCAVCIDFIVLTTGLILLEKLIACMQVCVQTWLRQRQQAHKKIQLPRCSICFEHESRVCFIPCGHVCCCVQCSQALLQHRDAKCPLCRRSITTAQYTYF